MILNIFDRKSKRKQLSWVILLLIKGIGGDINEIVVEEFLTTHKRKRQVVVAVE